MTTQGTGGTTPGKLSFEIPKSLRILIICSLGEQVVVKWVRLAQLGACGRLLCWQDNSTF
jgi:hypothetical protein